MKKASFVAIAVTLLGVAACNRGNQDQLNASDLNATQSLDELSNDAANLASESQQLQNQAEQLNQEAQSDNAQGPQTEADENIQGM